jgi:hypothetical protein
VPGIFSIGLQLLITALEDTMKRPAAAITFAASLVLATSINAAAQTSHPSNAQRALQWLQCTQQQPNGQIGSSGNAIARSSEVALSLAAAGQDASAMRNGPSSLADFLKSATSSDVGTNGELLMARASQPSAGPTATLATQLQATKGANGEYGGDIFSDALAILGLRSAGQTVGADAVAYLTSQQKSSGGWSFDNADQYGEDSNTTALVMQALLSAGVATDDAAITGGFTYLQSVFNHGGFGDAPGLRPDPNSDELGIFAIVAAHRQTDLIWGPRLEQAIQDLASQQISSGPDAGAIASQFSKLFTTTYAPSAFLLRALTQTGLAEGKVQLLPCPAWVVAAPTPTPVTPVLAQTGGPPGDPDSRLALTGLMFLAAGLGILRRRLRGRRR